MGLKGMVAVHGDRPVIAEVGECTQQRSRKPWVVSACGIKTSVLAEEAVGVVVHVHL
jgi:hypothetical protein